MSFVFVRVSFSLVLPVQSFSKVRGTTGTARRHVEYFHFIGFLRGLRKSEFDILWMSKSPDWVSLYYYMALYVVVSFCISLFHNHVDSHKLTAIWASSCKHLPEGDFPTTSFDFNISRQPLVVATFGEQWDVVAYLDGGPRLGFSRETLHNFSNLQFLRLFSPQHHFDFPSLFVQHHMLTNLVLVAAVDPASSHLCLSKIKPCMSQYKSVRRNCEWLFETVRVYLMVMQYMDNRCNSRVNACVPSRLRGRVVFIRCRTNQSSAWYCSDS